MAEGQNAEHLAKDFADDPEVYVPKIYWDYSAAHTLTLENVGYIKIADLDEVDAAGISRLKVAQKFYNIYMRQIFITNFVHADPHPGNIFIKPLPDAEEQKSGITSFSPTDVVPYKADRPFQVVFVDFGMVAVIPERLRAALQEYAIGIGTRDAYRVVQSYVKAGVLLPGADLRRLEEVHEAMFERFWGVRMGQMKDVALNEAEYFFREYRDVIYDAPFQFQVDMLFVMRAVGILSGMATNLDEEFDPWAETIPFAERLATQQLQRNWREWLQEIVGFGQLLFKLPSQLERILTLTQRGNLTVQMAMAPDMRKMTQRLEQSVSRLSWMVVAVGLLIGGVNLRVSGQDDMLGGSLLVLALTAFLWGVWQGR